MASSDINYSSVTNQGNPFVKQNQTTQDEGLATDSDNDDIPNSSGIMIHVVPDTSKCRWNHIGNLDTFFSDMYNYHQKHGFSVITMQQTFELTQFAFVVIFVTYIIHCLNYPVLFKDAPIPNNETNRTKVTLDDVMYPIGYCTSTISGGSWVILILATLFWLFRAIRAVYKTLRNWEIKKFYNIALKIEDSEIDNLTWHDVQRKTLEVQSEEQMCIHKEQLTELDIYHRILRFQNYMVAMMNKNLLPSKICLPFIGEWVCFSKGLRYNIEMILFRGPSSPFEKWNLKEDFKRSNKRNELAQKLSRQIFWVALGNLILSPLVFFWSLMMNFFHYADLIKREPGTLGSRCWSQYGRLYMRHFNELDHELNARLNRAYRPAAKYMSSFSSPLMAVIARNIIFICGGPLAILMLLAIYDEDVVQVEHVLMLMSILGFLVVIARGFIPDENLIWCPEQLMKAVLAHTHYIPVSWHGQAHTSRVRDQFGHIFQLRAIYLINELFSPIITPFVLMFCLRPRSLDIVDFFRNFTVSVVGVGDVCSFAQMDVRRHGNPDWQPTHSTDADIPEVLTPLCETNQYTQGENGKTELSLVHFTLTNPGWKMPVEAKQFVHGIKRHALHDIDRAKIERNTAMESSLFSVGSMGGEYASIVQSIVQTQNLPGPQMGLSSFQSYSGYNPQRNPFSPSDLNQTSLSRPSLSYQLSNINEDETETSERIAGTSRPANYERTTQSILGASMGMSTIGGITRREGPQTASQDGLLYSIYGAGAVDNLVPAEFTATDMCLSTLYLHELHQRQIKRRIGTIRSDHDTSWRQPHQTESISLPSTSGVGFSQPSTSAAVERTPLLTPKKS